MFSLQTPENHKNLWDLPNLLLQKFPAEEFATTAKVTLTPRFEGEKFGLIVMGLDYSYIGVTNKNGKLYVSHTVATDADRGTAETEGQPVLLNSSLVYLRVKVSKGAVCTFSFSTDGKSFTNLGPAFYAREGRWIGAKLGFFFNRPGRFNNAGSVDIDWIRFER